MLAYAVAATGLRSPQKRSDPCLDKMPRSWQDMPMTNEPTEPTITYGHYSDSGVRNYGQDAWSFLNPDHPTTKVEEIRYHAVDCQCDGCKALDEFYLDQL